MSDKAGNTDTDLLNLDWDTVVPNPPIVASSSPSSDSTPTWTWSYSTSADAISLYRRSLDGGTWTNTGLSSYTVSSHTPLADGPHTLQVARYDDAGNYSGYTSKTVVVNLANVTPYNNQIHVTTPVTLDWPSTLGVVSYGYSLYQDNGILRPTLISSDSGMSESNSLAITIFAGKNFYWSYSVSSKAGTVTSANFNFSS